LLHVPLIACVLISRMFGQSTDHKAPCYVVFSTPLFPRPSYAHITSSAPYSQTPSAYISPSVWQKMSAGYAVQLKCDGTRWRTGGDVSGKLANWSG
jgi:hypothetical protein